MSSAENPFSRHLKHERYSVTNARERPYGPKVAKKKRGHKRPKKGKEGEYANNCPHLPSLDWLVKNILEKPGTASKSAGRILAKYQERAVAAKKEQEEAASKRAEANMRQRILQFWE